MTVVISLLSSGSHPPLDWFSVYAAIQRLCPGSLALSPAHHYISLAQVVERGDCAARRVSRIWAAVREMNVISCGDMRVGSVKGNGMCCMIAASEMERRLAEAPHAGFYSNRPWNFSAGPSAEETFLRGRLR